MKVLIGNIALAIAVSESGLSCKNCFVRYVSRSAPLEELPLTTMNTRLLDPVRFRETSGLVLSESLLEKLERRFPWFPDCCLRFSPDWVEQRRLGGEMTDVGG